MNIDEIDIYDYFFKGFENDFMVKCCNDLFKPLGMDFLYEKKTFNN